MADDTAAAAAGVFVVDIVVVVVVNVKRKKSLREPSGQEMLFFGYICRLVKPCTFHKKAPL